MLLYLAALPVIALIFTIFTRIVFLNRLSVASSFRAVVDQKSHSLIAHVFAVVVVACGPLDIYINGFKLLEPLSYAELNGNGRFVRHISSMCWTLVPIAYLFHHGKKIKFILIAYSIMFAVVIIDRNRLLASFYCIAVCSALHSTVVSRGLSRVQVSFKLMLLLLGAMLIFFSGLGALRSGLEAFEVETSGESLVEGMFPLKQIFYYFPPLIQQIILYITTPIFNFATVLSQGFLNPEFLLSQLSPFNREMFDAYPYAPVLVPRFNVGTEFFPWLTYGGLIFVIPAFIFMLVCFLLSERLFRKFPNIFTLLIFLRLSYLVIFMGFAPQFYIFLNVGFIFLMFVLWGVSRCLINSSRAVNIRKYRG